MKDVCLIAAYTPDQQREDVLRNLTRFLKGKKDVVLISHTFTPKDIIDDVKYHIYDEENELLTQKSAPSHWWWCDLGDSVIWSNDVWYNDNLNNTYSTESHRGLVVGYTLLPCTRNFFFGLSMCKILGYEFAHYIEYDSEIQSVDFIDQANRLLMNYDGIVHWTKNNYPFGAFQSYNLNSYSFDELKWDKNLFLEEYKVVLKEEGVIESFVFNKMSKNKNILKKDLAEFHELKSHSPKIYYSQFLQNFIPCIFIIDENKKVIFFAKNHQIESIKISLIINHINNIDYVIEGSFWTLRDVGYIPEVKHIIVFLDDVKIKELYFTTEEVINKHRQNNKIVNK